MGHFIKKIKNFGARNKNKYYLCDMISLARHIELLLLEHDCVIVPGLGGFIANHADARYSGSEEELFLPPYRTIGFNQQLQVNDGLLVQSYMAAYDASYPAAQLQMEADIEKMMYELEMKGEYTFEHIGVVKKGLNHNITFAAPETGIMTPSLYGLYSYELKSLNRVVKEKEVEKALQIAAVASTIRSDETHPEPTEKEKTKRTKDIVIRLNRHWLDVSIAAAAAVLLLFCFSYPAMKNISTETDTVVATFYPINERVQAPAHPDMTPTAPTAPKQKENATAENKGLTIEETAQEKAETPSIEEKPSGKASDTPTSTQKADEAQFTIVLASYVSQHNAEIFIENLTKAGFAEGRYAKNGKVSRILYSNYASEKDAQSALQSLRQQNTEFAEAWVLEL